MDDQLLGKVYHELFDADKQRCPRRCIYSDSLVVLIYVLAVLRDRSVRWASSKKNWPLWMRRLKAISYSQLTRRLKTNPVKQLIAAINCTQRAQLPDSDEKFCDGKPLTVGGFSKDPDAAWGRLPGDGWGKGYKLHVIVDAAGAVEVFTVTELSASEPAVMRELVGFADLDGKLLRGDSAYDSNPLYGAVDHGGGRLLAPRKKPGRGLGHGKHHPHRLLACHQLEGSAETLKVHRRHRIRVEQTLGQLTNLPFGLSPLPNFVRRLHRVRLWLLAKITLYHCYLNSIRQQQLAA